MDFGFRMRLMRAVRDMSQIELSVYAAVNRDYLRRAEAGELELNDDAKERIRQALDWTPEVDETLERLEIATHAAKQTHCAPEAS